jgi:PAS domain S-box-containing protein
MDDLPNGAAAPWDREDAASRSLLRLIVQSTNDGVWDWDLETDAVYYSPRWLELIGYLPGELRGHIDTFIERLHPDDRTAVEQSIAEYRAGTRPEYRAELRLRHKDGSWRSILTRGIVLRDGGGRAVRFAGTHTDVTDRVRAAERLETMVTERTTDLRAARDRAELANAATTKFLATASHDIRQPLQAMALLLGGLKGEVATNEGARKLLAIERSLASGMELLDALLEFSKLDAGALRPRLTTVGIGDLFDVINDTFAVEAAQKNLGFTGHADGAGDAERRAAARPDPAQPRVQCDQIYRPWPRLDRLPSARGSRAHRGLGYRLRYSGGSAAPDFLGVRSSPGARPLAQRPGSRPRHCRPAGQAARSWN